MQEGIADRAEPRLAMRLLGRGKELSEGQGRRNQQEDEVTARNRGQWSPAPTEDPAEHRRANSE